MRLVLGNFCPSRCHAFFIRLEVLRFGQKISTFCAPPLSLAFVKYQFSKYGYFMIYCKKEIIHLWSDLKVRILSFLLFYRGGKGPTRGLVLTKRGGKGKGAVIMIFFPPSGNITWGPIKHIFSTVWDSNFEKVKHHRASTYRIYWFTKMCIIGPRVILPEGGKNIIITAPLPFPPLFVNTNPLVGPFPPR